MYFESRGQAGRILADQMFERYRYENCAVIALSDGGVLVAEQIAARLHSVLMLLVTEDIAVPGEGVAFGAISQHGEFTYNSSFSRGEIDEYTSEFHGYLDEQKREAYQKINRLLGEHGTIDLDLLRDHVVILVDDGFEDGATLDVVLDFLKPIRTQKLVVATPVSDIRTVDKVHVQADELHILDVKENYMGTDHYYENNIIPSHEETIELINSIIIKWH